MLPEINGDGNQGNACRTQSRLNKIDSEKNHQSGF